MDYAIARKILRDLVRVDRFDYPASRVLSVAHDNDRSLRHGGRWYSPLIDTMEDDLRARGTPCLSVARIISRIKGEAAYAHVVSPEGAFARALLTKRLKARFTPAHRYPYSGLEERAWGRILERTGARKVFGIQPSRELCVAARRRGAWVADVQHGVIGQSHPWYGARFRGSEPPEYSPHAFLCWDDASAEVTRHWAAAHGVQSIVIGNRWLARFMPGRTPDPLVSELLRDYVGAGLNPRHKPALLVALSWGEVNIPNGFLADALCDVIRKTADRFHWQVRLHPNQVSGFATHEGRRFREFFARHLEGHVEWQVATRSALPLVLRHTDLHICWNSSVALEAAGMGIRSAMLDPRLQPGQPFGDYYAHHRRTGAISIIEPTESSILTWIESHLDRRDAPEDFSVRDANYARVLDDLTR